MPPMRDEYRGSSMRVMLSVGVVWAVLTGLGMGPGLDGTAAARSDGPLSRAACVELARQKKTLDKGGVRKYLAMAPHKVETDFGKPVVERVRHYIALSEKVLFKCPRHILNANVGAVARQAVMPPLPVKGPYRARLRRPKRPLVPLPVKRQS